MLRMEICCLAVIVYIMIVFFKSKRKDTKENKIFVAFIANSFAYVSFETITVKLATDIESFNPVFCEISFRLYFVFAITVSFHFFWYVLKLIENSVRPETTHIFRYVVPIGVLIPAVLVLPYYINENEKFNYVYGPIFWPVRIAIIIYSTLSWFFIIKYRKNVDRKKFFAISLAYASMVIVLTLEHFNPTWLISGIGIALLDLAMFLMVESPDTLLIEQLQDEKERSNAANRAKSIFIANISHEIRTPINVVMGMNEMILRESKEEQIKRYALDVQSSTRTLSGIINDILDLTKIESGKMEIVPVEYEFSNLINDLSNMISVRADAKNLSFVVDVDTGIPSRLRGDDVRIKQVLLNLLTNAVKYTDKGGVTLRVVRKDLKKGRIGLHFEIQDTGIGIKEEDIEKIYVAFERFERLRNRYVEGAGLGMNIAQSLLKMMDSSIVIKSVYGEGSTFSFDLYQTIVDATPVGSIQKRLNEKIEKYVYTPSFSTPAAHYLIVDDNEANRRVFKNLIKFTRADVDEAGSGYECLDMIKKKKYDLIFMDHMMPVMDGVETLDRMNELGESRCKDTPVVIVTANAVAGAKEWYISKGFKNFISKPVIPEKLEEVIKDTVREELISAAFLNEDSESEEETDENTKSVEEELPIVDGIDWNYAMIHFSTKELLLSAVSEVYMSIDREGKEIEEMISKQHLDLDSFRIKVHGMKSTSALIGAVPVSGIAKLLENAAKEKNESKILDLLPTFLEEWYSLKAKLEPLVKKNDDPKLEIDTQIALALLEMIDRAAEDLNVDDLDDSCKKLCQFNWSGKLKETVDKLVIAIEELDANKIMNNTEVIRKIMQK